MQMLVGRRELLGAADNLLVLCCCLRWQPGHCCPAGAFGSDQIGFCDKKKKAATLILIKGK